MIIGWIDELKRTMSKPLDDNAIFCPLCEQYLERHILNQGKRESRLLEDHYQISHVGILSPAGFDPRQVLKTARVKRVRLNAKSEK